MNKTMEKHLDLWKDNEISKTTIPVSGLIYCLREELLVSPDVQKECIELILKIFHESLIVTKVTSTEMESDFFARNIFEIYPELNNWRSGFEGGQLNSTEVILFYKQLLNNWKRYCNDKYLLRNLEVLIMKYCVFKPGKSCADYYDNVKAIIEKPELLREGEKYAKGN